MYFPKPPYTCVYRDFANVTSPILSSSHTPTVTDGLNTAVRVNVRTKEAT